MSYCRFGENSDVYMFSTGDDWECCSCILRHDNVGPPTLTEAIAHLEEHIAAGHAVPDYALERLQAEKETGQTVFGEAIQDDMR